MLVLNDLPEMNILIMITHSLKETRRALRGLLAAPEEVVWSKLEAEVGESV